MSIIKDYAWRTLRGVLVLCLTLALCLDMTPHGVMAERTNRMMGIFYNFQISLAGKGVSATILFLSLLFVNRYIDRIKTQKKRLFTLAGLLISGIWLMGEGFNQDNLLWSLYASYGQILKSGIYLVGSAYGLNQLAYFLYEKLEQLRSDETTGAMAKKLAGRRLSYLAQMYWKHTFLVSFGAIFILWLPHLILAYPANFISDAYGQLAQFLGLTGYSTHHPLANTMLMGILIEAGSAINANFGPFLYIIVQTVFAAAVLAHAFTLYRELGIPARLRMLFFGCCVFVPYYSAYIGVIVKDVPYSYFVLLFMTELIYLFIQKEAYFRSRKHVFLFVGAVVGTILMRNNGKHVVYPTAASVLLYLFIRRKKRTGGMKRYKRFLRSAAALFLIPVLLAEGISAALINGLHSQPYGIRDALSLFMQQTARYVKEYADEVTPQEKAAISAVLDYEHLAENYAPWSSDPVKNTFKYDVSAQELKAYFGTWLRQFIKHPFTYVKATVNQNYYLLYPYIENSRCFINRFSDEAAGSMQRKIIGKMGWSDTEAIAAQKEPLYEFYQMSFCIPVLNMLSHPAFYTILLILLSIFSIYRKRYNWLIVSIPLWLSLAVVILAPVIQGHPRYAFPIIYSMPVLFAYYLYLRRGGDVDDCAPHAES